MHEMSIALSILDIAATESAARDNAAILAIHLRLGPMSGVVKEALMSAFELAREGSVCPESKLVVEDVPLVAMCPVCRKQQSLPSCQDLTCPVCGSLCPELVSGRELEIVAMEIEG